MELLLGLAFLGINSEEISELKETVQIIEQLQPKVSEQYALELASSINRVVKKYELPKTKFIAILFQESSLWVDPSNCLKNSESCSKDYGIGQVNFPTWGEHLNIDKVRALTDLQYSVEISAKVLHSYKRFKKSEKNWWSRYHSKTPERRKDYEERVLYHYGKIALDEKETRDGRFRTQNGERDKGKDLLPQGVYSVLSSPSKCAPL